MIRTSRPPSVHSTNTEHGDPFSAHLRPPPGETEHDRQLRLQQEAEAKRISDSIDEELKQDAKRLQKRKQDVKVRATYSTCRGRSTSYVASLPAISVPRAQSRTPSTRLLGLQGT